MESSCERADKTRPKDVKLLVGPPRRLGAQAKMILLANSENGTVQGAVAISLPTSQEMRFRPGGTMEISRWWSPSVTTGAGQNRFCVPAGTPDQDSQQCQCCSGALPGRACLCRCVSGGYARAPPPANFRRASGAKICG